MKIQNWKVGKIISFIGRNKKKNSTKFEEKEKRDEEEKKERTQEITRDDLIK